MDWWLMFFFYVMWMTRSVCVTHQKKKWHQDALWEEVKPVSAQWYFGNALVGKVKPILFPVALTRTTWVKWVIRDSPVIALLYEKVQSLISLVSTVPNHDTSYFLHIRHLIYCQKPSNFWIIFEQHIQSNFM